MIRKIIQIDEEKCIGCELCVNACHEGAIGMRNGKAVLLRDDYCDGLGNCLPACPTNAITFVEREALPFDQAAVQQNIMQKKMQQSGIHIPSGGCPGSQARQMNPGVRDNTAIDLHEDIPSQLRQWPIQIQLAPTNAAWFADARLLIAADCSAFAYGDFHRKFIRDHVTLVGCPKLDDVEYSQKLTTILRENAIQDITVVRMEVPCCGGIVNAVRTALANCGKDIPCTEVTISLDGRILPQ